MSDAGHTLRSPIFITRHFSRTSQIEGEVGGHARFSSLTMVFPLHSVNACPPMREQFYGLASLSSLSFGREKAFLSIDAIYATGWLVSRSEWGAPEASVALLCLPPGAGASAGIARRAGPYR